MQTAKGTIDFIWVPEFFPEQGFCPFHGGFNVFEFTVLQSHLHALHDTPGGNVPTHDACTNDMNAAKTGIGLFTDALEAFHQEKDTPQAL